MEVGDIRFEVDSQDRVLLTLLVGGEQVLKSCSVESIAREAEIRRLRALRLDKGFTIHLPADPQLLAQAAHADFKFPLAVAKLIAECAWLADMSSLTLPERRRRR